MKKKNAIALAAGALVFGMCSGAFAASVNVTDNYWGGEATSNHGAVVPADVLGGVRYGVSGLVATKTGDDLEVVISTDYANSIGAGGTHIGSLFIGNGENISPGALLAGADTTTDTFTADTDRYSYVFDFDIPNADVKLGGSGTGTLSKLNETGSDVELSSGTTYRKNQAVDRIGDATAAGVGNWKVTDGTVTFTVKDFFTLGGINQTALTLAWTMSCANDIILGVANLGRRGPGEGEPPNVAETPIPAGAVLLLSGLAGLGAFGRRKAKS
jgi:hypothetical protein